MESLLAILIGGLFAAAVYMLLRRSIIKLIIGLILISHTCNLIIFTIGGVMRGKAPIIEEGEKHLSGLAADPLPQALILTAIVIGFGVIAFSIVLLEQVYKTTGISDTDDLINSDK